jgi:hypothetical protein
MDVYANLCALARTDPRPCPGRGALLQLCPGGALELSLGAWPARLRCSGCDGWLAVRVTPDNHATYCLTEADQGANVVFGQLGLGAIANHRGTIARLLFWLGGQSWPYAPGLQADLASGAVLGAVAPAAALAVDATARDALLALIKSKTVQVQGYLRVAGFTLDNLPRPPQHARSPAHFIAALHADTTSVLAAIPLTMQRGELRRRLHGLGVALPAIYPDALKTYLAQNRAALYQAAGVVRPQPA